MNFLHYDVIELIGEGGMGKVYLAEDTMLEKKVALKVLSPELSRESLFIERFKREAKIQSKLSHPNITTLYNLLLYNDTYFIVMEYVSGVTLYDLLLRTGLIIESKALIIFEQIYNALTYAHSKYIIHRDIKPSNIMISDKDEVKIMDFGIAKLLGERNITRTNTKMGSLYYMSPEQINTPKDVDYRSDLFSLGIVLFEMVTGKLPYNIDTDSDYKIMSEILNNQIPSPTDFYPHISEKTVNLIFSLTNKDKNFRNVNHMTEKGFTLKQRVNFVKDEKTIFSDFSSNAHTNYQVTDIDENRYKTIKIGSQILMAENLNVSHYSNGDVIPQVQDKDKWAMLKTGAWCYYKNKIENGKSYGKLYNWFAVNDPRGLAPVGWHIPSDKEWTILSENLGGDSVAGGKLKATTLWISPNTGATNESGFTAYPGGSRDYIGLFNEIERNGYFWSASEFDIGYAWYRALFYDDLVVHRFHYSKEDGFSVRCVKD